MLAANLMSQLVPDGSLCIQDEVARRLTLTQPGASGWRAMTIETQYYSKPRYCFKVGVLAAGHVVPTSALPHPACHANILK